MSESSFKPYPTSGGSASSESKGKCPFHNGGGGGQSKVGSEGPGNKDWWPEALDLSGLNGGKKLVDPLGDFDYAAAFATLDLEAVKSDLIELMTTSQDWWPADYGHYGPFFVRMAWHSAGTYRMADGRGGASRGMQRFAPLNSWPDNANLDKARRLLWPIKSKYGNALSWADLMVFAGTVAMESMGLPSFGFAGGREDVFEPEELYWGPETEWLAGDKRYSGDRQLEQPLGAVQMGLIYVNPEGPNGDPDAAAAARDIRETFARMAMNDVETVALIAGGHTFGKAHGAAPDTHVGPEPAGADITAQGLGWANEYGSGKGGDTITSGLEGAWTATPITWDNSYLETLFGHEWEKYTGPGGATQWRPKDGGGEGSVPDAHDEDTRHAPMMFTTDLALRVDPEYEKISRHFLEHPDEFADAFARAWYKLTHRDMGPPTRFLGPLVPDEVLIWQDPVPPHTGPLVNCNDVAALKAKILSSGLSIPDLVFTAWASASTFRNTDKRGGANGARIRLAPQKDWKANAPSRVSPVLDVLESIQTAFNKSAPGHKSVSLADMIVLGGSAAIETAAASAGYPDLQVPFFPGRTDATDEMTDADSFAVLEPTADGFRNYLDPRHAQKPEALLVDRAALLGLSATDMTALIGGLRVLGTNWDGSDLGVFTDSVGTLSTDFFTHLLNDPVSWSETNQGSGIFLGRHSSSRKALWRATRVDLIFGSHSQLRAIAELYASADGTPLFLSHFVHAWLKVMNADRFDLSPTPTALSSKL